MNASPGMTIGGRVVTSGETFEVVNPATGEAWTEVPECTAAQLDDAFAAAASVQKDWSSDEERRREALGNMADALEKAADDLAPLLTAENGKSLTDARSEVGYAAYWLRAYAAMDLPPMVTYADPAAGKITEMRRSIGPVAAITPWNFPLNLGIWKLAPAFLTGNTVVLKPSPFTPVSTLRMGELLQEVLPAGVLNVVSGGDELGARMTAHPVPRKVSFTGSIEGGKAVARSAADDLKRVTLELGGNDAAVLLEDVDVESVASKIFWGGFFNNGQVCGGIKRVYVPQARAAELTEALAAIARTVKVGDGREDDTVLGPLTTRPQFERVVDLLNRAKAQGATVVAGGDVATDGGYFVTPTILTGAGAGNPIVEEEQFGPVLPVVSYASIEEAVEQINDTKFGLGSSVWGTDIERLYEVASGLDAGITWVNAHAALTPDVPFGGAKWSGLGLEGGVEGLKAYTQLHVIQEPPAT